MSFSRPKLPELPAPIPPATTPQSPFAPQTAIGAARSPLSTQFLVNRPMVPLLANPRQPGRRSLIGGSQ